MCNITFMLLPQWICCYNNKQIIRKTKQNVQLLSDCGEETRETKTNSKLLCMPVTRQLNDTFVFVCLEFPPIPRWWVTQADLMCHLRRINYGWLECQHYVVHWVLDSTAVPDDPSADRVTRMIDQLINLVRTARAGLINVRNLLLTFETSSKT